MNNFITETFHFQYICILTKDVNQFKTAIMNQPILSVEEYVAQIPKERKEVIEQLRTLFKNNLPAGFQEEMSYGMIGFVVPHSLYPKGYHCNPKLPLPFISIASQKNFVAIYHMGMYAQPDLMDWFITAFPKYSSAKLDMGKSCIRFKKMDQIPFELLAELATKMTPQHWVELYESAFVKK